MEINREIFKAYDIRGRYPKEINEEVVAAIAKAFAAHLEAWKVVVGRDVRESGPALFDAVCRAFKESGVHVFDIGVVPVDVYYFASEHLGVDGGVFISASHNPREWNGLKLVRSGMGPLSAESGLVKIYELAVKDRKPELVKPGTIQREDVLPAYFDFLLEKFDVANIKPMKMVMNANFGMSGKVFRQFVERANLPLTLVGLDEEPDGTFPKGSPNPMLPQNRKETSELVKSAGADMGIAWDADGDRVFFYDERGELVEGCFMTALFAQEILKKKPGSAIVGEPRVIWPIKDVVERGGGRLIISRVGHSFIPEVMKREGAVFAGELSSHFYFEETMSLDSGIYPVLLLLDLLSREGKPFSEVVRPLLETHFISGEINFETEKKDEIIARAESEYKDGTVEHIDGLSVEYSDWRFNLRKSNTESLLRLNIEARSREVLDRELAKLKEFITS